MRSKALFACLGLAVLAMPANRALAQTQLALDGPGELASPGQIDPHFELTPLNVASGVRIAPRPAVAAPGAYPDVALPRGVRDPDGPMQYIDGPAWIYHPARNGPSFEVAALGGGMYSAPFLAHVGMDWHF